MMLLDPFFIIFVTLPALALSGAASMYTKSTFKKYSKVASSSRMNAAEAAKRMLQFQGVEGVSIQRAQGFLSDHYNPANRTLNLSESVYDSSSLAAIGIACHEAGHAVQHATNYPFLRLRSALVPATNIGSNMGYGVAFLGVLINQSGFMLLGALLFSVAVLFSIITLPVEWNASARAKTVMVKAGVVTEQEARSAGSVLNAAFLTYVAAAVSSLLTLLYFLLQAGIGND